MVQLQALFKKDDDCLLTVTGTVIAMDVCILVNFHGLSTSVNHLTG